MHATIHTWRSKDNLGCQSCFSPFHLSLCCLPLYIPGWLVLPTAGDFLVSPFHLCTKISTATWFYLGSGYLNTGLRGFVASILTTKSSLPPPIYNLCNLFCTYVVGAVKQGLMYSRLAPNILCNSGPPASASPGLGLQVATMVPG